MNDDIKNKRAVFSGIVEKFGNRFDFKYEIETIVLNNIKDTDGNIIASHVIFDHTKGWKNQALQPGNIVQFEARFTEPFKLSNPTKIQRLSKQQQKVNNGISQDS